MSIDQFAPETDTEAGVPIGRPMDNNTLYLLDSLGRFVAPGEPGEIYVGGVQLARGYLGRPDLTRQRFVRLADGTRVYRTGDMARLLPSGERPSISRIDDQVKVAGHRVEPRRDRAGPRGPPRGRPGRRGGPQPPRPPGQGAVRLRRTRPGACADLKEFLAGRLPGYMIPAAIIAVPQIPRNPNGKTDIRQLPDPFSPSVGVCDAPAPDRDDVTNAVAGIWARALRLDARLIDERTDFRQLGGNSILMLSMINEVSRAVAGDAHAEFMAELGQILREPTLGRVSDIARQALTSLA